METLKKVEALSQEELEKIIGGGPGGGGTDSKDCTSGLGSGESNTDYSC